jgi:nucleoside-diphosphate-sugar epimerase
MSVYLVTGCAGFIASYVTKLLAGAGHTVVGVDNLNDAYDVRLKHRRLDELKTLANFVFQHGDITNLEQMRGLFQEQQASQGKSYDAVFNLAARAGVRQSVENPWAYFETNTTGTLNLLELCREFGTAKFILSSTSSLYGKNNVMPFREDANTDQPLSPYAASKKAAEALCYTYHHLYNLDVTVFRFFTVYGPAGRPDMSLFRFVQWICEGHPVLVYGDGQQSRDFTFVEDIALGVIAGLKPLGYEIVNLGSDTPVVLMDAIRLVERLVGRSATLKFVEQHAADVQATWADVSKAQSLLGWTPQTNFETGVEKLVEWYMANRAWASILKV